MKIFYPSAETLADRLPEAGEAVVQNLSYDAPVEAINMIGAGPPMGTDLASMLEAADGKTNAVHAALLAEMENQPSALSATV